MAWFLAMNVTVSQPTRLGLAVYAAIHTSHCTFDIANEPVAGCQVSIGGNTEIARSCAAWIGPVSSLVDFTQGVHHVGKRIAVSGNQTALKLPAASDHLAEHDFEVFPFHLIHPIDGIQQR